MNSDFINQIENNPWILAFAVIISNIGFNYILDDLDDRQKSVLNNKFLRKVYLFGLIYCGTKDFMISLISTIVYAMAVHWL
tara:strand:- start:4293 stop:4535 length:243 start_codon:yes stop_codon:yes gene_type:complete